MMQAKRARNKRQAAEEITMYQRALPVRQVHIAPGEMLGARARLNARTRFRAFADHCLLLLRRLGEFFAAGGPLS